MPNPPPPPPPPMQSISPSILVILAIISIIFFISAILHLLARYLLRSTTTNPEATDADNATALQGQLGQLFHLHDSGVDQLFIDTLPVFHYKAIIGRADPFDCAVCLSEFEPDDELRLLPRCSHAFHVDCIDTWLLSHSTCPLCRGSLLQNLSPCSSPVAFVLESAGESEREIAFDGDEIQLKEETGVPVSDVSEAPAPETETTVVSVKLGKFRNVDANEGEHDANEGSSSCYTSNFNWRRCYSMGSFEYVLDESPQLQVAIKPTKAKPLAATSEWDCHSRRDGFRELNPQKGENFSFSKIWLRTKKAKSVADESGRRAVSFRLPLHRGDGDESKAKIGSSGSSVSEFDVAGWLKSNSGRSSDVEVRSYNEGVVTRADEAPSFARGALLRIMGRQNRVVNHV